MIASVANQVGKFVPAGSSASNIGQNKGELIVWVLAGLCVIIALCMMLDGIVRRRRFPVYAPGATSGAERPGFVEVPCVHCHVHVMIPKPLLTRPFTCPDCSQPNPAPRRDYFRLVKKFVRWLFYPSFQDWV